MSRSGGGALSARRRRLDASHRKATMPEYVQTNRPLRVATTLGEDKFLLASVQGREAVSQPYEFRLELRSEDSAVDGAALLRTAVAVSIETDTDTPRYIHGVVRRFVQLGRREDIFGYELDIVPWFWLLSLSRDCRIFQNLTVLEIVQQVFKELGFKPTEHFRNACTKTYAKRDYCVQYRETHMDFVSRLLEDEGIFYFFEHTDSKHVMVLADANNAFPTCAASPKLHMGQEDDHGSLDVVGSLAREDAVHTGRVTLKDYDYLQPALTLEGSISGTGPEELYDFPGGFTAREEGDRRARLQLEAEEALQQVVRARSTCRGVQAGTRFDLEDHYRPDVNQNYIVLEASLATSAENFLGWEGGSAFEYRNEFLAIPFKTPYLPRRRTPRPLVAGTQTALVVGPSGEEVWVDKHGRVKVQFYWDRLGGRDDKSSCWVRVSTAWAGKGWGSVSIPRIGNEVVVDFLEGDPDRPLIVGSVYNADQTPPFTLPGAGIQMGMKSRSSKGGGGMNEITMTDTKGKELVNIHAQYDMTTTVENNQTNTIHNNRSSTVDVNDTESVGSNQTVTVGSNQTVSVGSNQSITVGASRELTVGSAESTTVGAGQTVSVGAGQNVSVGGSRRLSIGGSDAMNVTGSQEISVSGSETIKGGGGVTISSPASIKLECGGSTIEMTPGSIKVSSPTITITGAGLVTVTGGVVKVNS